MFPKCFTLPTYVIMSSVQVTTMGDLLGQPTYQYSKIAIKVNPHNSKPDVYFVSIDNPLKADPTDFMADLESWESVILSKSEDEVVFHLRYHFRPSRHGAYSLITMTFYMKAGEIDHSLLYMKHGSKPQLDMYCKYYS